MYRMTKNLREQIIQRRVEGLCHPCGTGSYLALFAPEQKELVSRVRGGVIEILPRAIVQKGVQIVKDHVEASLDGTPITLDSILEKRRNSYEEKLEHRCRMELYEKAVHEEYGDGGVALLHELSRIHDLRDLKRQRVAESSFSDGWKRFSDDLLFGRVLLYSRGKLIRFGENFLRVVP